MITCRPKFSFQDVLARHHAQIEHKLDLVSSDGAQHGSLIFWTGPTDDAENAFKAMLAAGEFIDKQRNLRRRIEANRVFDLAQPSTRTSWQRSAQSIDQAAAVLMVTGKLNTGESPAQYFRAAQEAGDVGVDALSRVPGMIARMCLASSGAKAESLGAIGGCYLFTDEEAMAAFTESDIWAQELAAHPWESVSVEKFGVMAAPAAPAA